MGSRTSPADFAWQVLSSNGEDGGGGRLYIAHRGNQLPLAVRDVARHLNRYLVQAGEARRQGGAKDGCLHPVDRDGECHSRGVGAVGGYRGAGWGGGMISYLKSGLKLFWKPV